MTRDFHGPIGAAEESIFVVIYLNRFYLPVAWFDAFEIAIFAVQHQIERRSDAGHERTGATGRMNSAALVAVAAMINDVLADVVEDDGRDPGVYEREQSFRDDLRGGDPGLIAGIDRGKRVYNENIQAAPDKIVNQLGSLIVMNQDVTLLGSESPCSGQIGIIYAHAASYRTYAVFSQNGVGIILIPIGDIARRTLNPHPGLAEHHTQGHVQSYHRFTRAAGTADQRDCASRYYVLNEPSEGARFCLAEFQPPDSVNLTLKSWKCALRAACITSTPGYQPALEPINCIATAWAGGFYV